MRYIEMNKPLMIVEYLLEHESKELYLSDFAINLGIKVKENGVAQGYSVSTLHELKGKPNNLDFCWSNEKFVSIKEMEKFIAKAKKKGATHLDIHFHSDHGNYNLNALRFRMATEKELKTVNDSEIKEKAKQISKQISELNKEIEKLEKWRLQLLKFELAI